MGSVKKQHLHLPPPLTLQLKTMKGGVVTKLRLIVFLPTILVLWDDKGTFAGSVPQMHDNSQLPKFLVLDKPGGKKSLIEIEGKIGRKESVQKITDKDGGILTDKGGFCSKDEDCPKGELCLGIQPICVQPIKNAQPPKEVDERCKEKKCGESCRPKPRVYGACDDNQQCVSLFRHPGCKQGEIPGPPCEGPPDYGFYWFLWTTYGFKFDPVSKTCKDTMIRGIGRTNNGFLKLDECEEKCIGDETVKATTQETMITPPHGHKSPTPDCSSWSCPYNYDPVCGSDGKTYPNKCVFKRTAACEDGKEDLVIASDGPCSGARTSDDNEGSADGIGLNSK